MKRCVVLCLLAMLVAEAPAQAARGGAPPWRSGAAVTDRLFEAQRASLLGERGVRSNVGAARRAYRGRLRSGIRDASPPADRAVLAGLDAAARARSSVALATARGTAQGALLRGSAQATVAAVERGDASAARGWLLLRESARRRAIHARGRTRRSL